MHALYKPHSDLVIALFSSSSSSSSSFSLSIVKVKLKFQSLQVLFSQVTFFPSALFSKRVSITEIFLSMSSESESVLSMLSACRGVFLTVCPQAGLCNKLCFLKAVSEKNRSLFSSFFFTLSWR